MIKFALIFSLLSFGHQLHADDSCAIETGHKVFHLGSQSSGQPLPFLHSNCPESVNRAFTELVLNGNGTLRAQQLVSLIEADHQKNLTITPELIMVTHLPEKLKRHFSLASNYNFRELSFLDRSPLLLGEGEWLEFSCGNCTQTGEHNIQLTIRNNESRNTQTRYVKTKVMARTSALVASSNLRVSNENASLRDFTIEEVETLRPENLFMDTSKLAFYRLNRPLNRGDQLQHHDLTPATLVQPGTTVQVILKSGNLSLKTTANPMRPGRFGESVQLRHPTTNKTITGKVIDFNKVEVN